VLDQFAAPPRRRAGMREGGGYTPGSQKIVI
jgi:hypothetical protein